MPAPDPFGLHYDETPDGRPMIKSEIWPSDGMFAKGNRRHRLARAKAVVRKLTLNGWACRECGGHVPLTRRADAVYCGESCRKRAKRKRQALETDARRRLQP
ncbi:MAG: hypothetical protein H6897_14395 [Rhodobacteraceae bacterium]|nr:hypothetical protein [Paracoccaceae bacterium]